MHFVPVGRFILRRIRAGVQRRTCGKNLKVDVDLPGACFDLLVKEVDMTSRANTSKQWAARKLTSVLIAVFVPLFCLLTHPPEPSVVVSRPALLYAAALYRLATGQTAEASSLIERAVNADEKGNLEAAGVPKKS
jgi:hypothetical protein